MKINVNFSELETIGNTIYGDKTTHFICDATTANIKRILLRNILSIRGYEIESEEDFVWNEHSIDILFNTNMPWTEYKKLFMD